MGPLGCRYSPLPEPPGRGLVGLFTPLGHGLFVLRGHLYQDT